MNESQPTPIWIDCDPGHDDAFAILLATQSSEIELIGISIVHGNDAVELCGLNAKRFLWTCGVFGVPVYLGSGRPLLRNTKFCPEIHGIPGEHGVSGMSGFHFPDEEIFAIPEYEINKGHGVVKMKEAILNHERNVTIVATGAQTNIALLLRMFPEVTKNVEKIVFMGGAIGLGNTGVAAEFNIEVDPEAAFIVLHSGIPLAMVPLEVTHTILVTDEILEQIKHIGQWKVDSGTGVMPTSKFYSHPHVEYAELSRVIGSKHPTRKKAELKLWTNEEGTGEVSQFGNCCYQLLSFFKTTYREVFSFDSPPLHDPCTIFFITNPEAFETLNVFVDVETGSEKCMGRTLVDIHGILKKKPNVTVCTRIDSTKFWQKMLKCLQLANSKSPLNKH